MKFLRRHAPLMAIVMSLNLLFVSCAPTADDDSATISAKYSGEEIFQGLFFFQHDIATNISQLNQVAVDMNETRAEDPAAGQYLNDLSVMTTDYINTNYPGFFADLETVIYSGDYYQIQEKLDLSGQLIEQAILTSGEFGATYALGKEIGKDPELLAKIQALDLTQEADRKQLEKLLATIDGITEIDAENKGLVVVAVIALAGAVAAVVASVYVLVGASVLVKTNNWVRGPEEHLQADEDTLLSDELFVAEVSKFFRGGK